MSVAAFHFDRDEAVMLTASLYCDKDVKLPVHWMEQIADGIMRHSRVMYFIGEVEPGLIANEPVVRWVAFTLDHSAVEAYQKRYEATCSAFGIGGSLVVWDYRVDTLSDEDYTLLYRTKDLFIP